LQQESVKKIGDKLHTGPSTTKNAIALLELAGYPKEITTGARSRIKNNY